MPSDNSRKSDDIIRFIANYMKKDDTKETLKAINETFKDLINSYAGGAGTGIAFFIDKYLIEREDPKKKLTNEALKDFNRSLYAFTLLLSDCIDAEVYKDNKKTIEESFDEFIKQDRNTSLTNELTVLLSSINKKIVWYRLNAYMGSTTIKKSLEMLDYPFYIASSQLEITPNLEEKPKKIKNNFDFNNIPKSRLLYSIQRDEIIKKIIDNQESCFLLHADGGYGKSTVIRQVGETSSFLSRFDYGYAYSFYSQSKPNDDSEMTYVDSVEFFHKCLSNLPLNVDTVRTIIEATEQVYAKFTQDELKELSDKDIAGIVLKKGAGVEGFWAEVLYQSLSENKILLFIDGMEVVQDKASGAILNSELRVFLSKLNNQIDSKVIITSRIKSKVGTVERLKKFNTGDVKSALATNGFIQTDIDAIGDRINALTIPIVLNYVIVLAKKMENNISKALESISKKLNNHKIFTNDDIQSGKQSESIVKAIIEQLKIIINNKEDEKDRREGEYLYEFIKVASLFDRPMNKHEYIYLQGKFSTLLPVDIPENEDFFFYDEDDAIPSIDIHPIVSKVLYSMIKTEDNDNFKNYTEAMAEYYSKRYKLTSNPEERHAIYRAIDFWNKADDIVSIEKAFIGKINGSDHIKAYAEHPRAYSVLNICIKNQDKLNNKFKIFKAYSYFAMTLGKSKEAIEVIDKIEINAKYDTKTDLQTAKEEIIKYDFNDKILEHDNETIIEIYRFTEEVDWYMSLIENYKYLGKILNNDAKERIQILIRQEATTNIEKFWTFQLKTRYEEYGYYIDGKYKTDINTLLNEFIPFRNPQSEWPDKLIKHPHNLWFERYYSTILDDCIDQKKECSNQDLYLTQRALINMYKERRIDYYQQGLINELKYNCCRLLEHENDKVIEAAYNETKELIREANEKISKNDFILQSLLDMALCDTLLKIKIEDGSFIKIENMVKNTDFEFFKLDFELLKFLRGELAEVALGDYKYEHRRKRYKAFKSYKNSQAQSS